MKSVHLYQFIDSWKHLATDVFEAYINYLGIGEAQHGVRESEMIDLESLVKNMLQYKVSYGKCDGFFINYSIPQIKKEFDLLRFGIDYIINIEIKRTSTAEKIEKQLRRNLYYLKFTQKPVRLFTFVAETKELFQLKGNVLEKTEFKELADCITEQKYNIDIIPDNVFNPSEFLVSPFNSTRQFMENDYFLTNHQEEIKVQVMQAIDSHSKKCISITGKAGTGKTLLVYDIAKSSIQKGKKVLILHCAQLNKGQHTLINDYGWIILQAKDGAIRDFNEFDVIIIDESQRARSLQFSNIIKKIKASTSVFIFSHDSNQCLHVNEVRRNISGQILSICDSSFTLTNKIRTNKEIADFIIQLFDSKSQHEVKSFPHVSISFCINPMKAKCVLTHFSENGWKVPNYTPGTISSFYYEEYCVSGEESVHAVIGQEYDCIVGVIDNHFYYDGKGILQSRQDGYYSQRQMLFQILTRARMKLHILVLNNPDVFTKCIQILSKQ